MINEDFWLQEFTELYGTMFAVFRSSAMAGADEVFATLAEASLGTDEAAVYSDILEWGAAFLPTRVSQVTASTREAVEQAIKAYQSQEGITLDEFLLPIFSPERADNIGISETTLGYSVGNLLAWRSYGIIETAIWVTAEDEKVCPVCRELDGLELDIVDALYGGTRPPAHPRCRCMLMAVLSLSRRACLPILNAVFSGRLDMKRLERVAVVV